MSSRTRRFRPASMFACMAAFLWLSACAPAEDTNAVDESVVATDAATVEESAGQPEVFFTTVEDGGTYATSHELIFAVENFSIVPVEKPPEVRAREGHYHLAVDADCVASGEIIPPGTPSYIHFGTGNDRITLQLEAGDHSLCLQVADGEHRVIAGPEQSLLTKQIHVMVSEQ